MYALCFHAVETGVYADMPEILPHLQAMKNGLEMAYQKLAIPMHEYRKFVVSAESLDPERPIEACSLPPKEQRADATEGEEDHVEMGTQEQKEG